MNKPQRHIIHKAMQWKSLLDNGEVESLSEIAKTEGLSRARVTQIMNLLKLPTKYIDFLVELDEPKDIRKYSEKKLRDCLSAESFHKLPPIDGKPKSGSARRNRPKKKKRRPKNWIDQMSVKVVIVGPIPLENFEALKRIVKETALRKLKELEEKQRKTNKTIQELLEEERKEREARRLLGEQLSGGVKSSSKERG